VLSNNVCTTSVASYVSSYVSVTRVHEKCAPVSLHGTRLPPCDEGILAEHSAARSPVVQCPVRLLFATCPESFVSHDLEPSVSAVKQHFHLLLSIITGIACCPTPSSLPVQQHHRLLPTTIIACHQPASSHATQRHDCLLLTSTILACCLAPLALV
jgi:hypothetical protein